MQNWKKLGLLYGGENYAAVPIAYHLVGYVLPFEISILGNKILYRFVIIN